jgi:ACT domain-containing protein
MSPNYKFAFLFPCRTKTAVNSYNLSWKPIYYLAGGFVQVSMKLEMKDSPGQLVAALKPISDVGGNIIAVIHQREPDTDTLDVQIVLELPKGRLEKLKILLKEQGVHIQRIGEERLLFTRTVIMIGHLMHTDLSDTVDQIDSTGFAEVSELSMSMPAIKERSSSRITIKSVSRDDMAAALAILRRVALQKSLLLVEPLEDIA